MASTFAPDIASPVPAGDVVRLDVARSGDRLSVSAAVETPGDAPTARRRDEVLFDAGAVADRCRDLTRTLNTATRRGLVTPDILDRLRDMGQVFADDLLPDHAKDILRGSGGRYLVLNLDEELTHIPWELLHDGDRFLCQRFAMGRLTRIDGRGPSPAGRRSASPSPRLLILADPAGDLDGAYGEGIQLRDHADQRRLRADFRADRVTPDMVRERLRQYDMVHFAGHCDYDPDVPDNSGWRLAGGHLRAGDVRRMNGTGLMPAFVFSNACQSARSGEWRVRDEALREIHGLASAFLLAGVRHYLGTFWEIPDEPGRCFALAFYHFLLDGHGVGEAVRLARLRLLDRFGESGIVWASYLLYGDPSFAYLPGAGQPAPETRSRTELERPVHVRGGYHPPGEEEEAAGAMADAVEDVIDFGAQPPVRSGKRTAKIVAALALLAAMVLAAMALLRPAAVSVTVPREAPSLSPADRAKAEAERRARLERLMAALTRLQEGAPAGIPSVATDRPLTLWMAGVDAGLSPEGPESPADAAESLSAALLAALAETGPAKLVERERLDDLLAELDLGASTLADPEAALMLGRLLAARLMLTGRLVSGGEEGPLAVLRLVETETGAILAVFSRPLSQDSSTTDTGRVLAGMTRRAIEERFSPSPRKEPSP